MITSARLQNYTSWLKFINQQTTGPFCQTVAVNLKIKC